MATPETPTQQQTLGFMELWSLCISKWRWFLLSVGLCLLAAALYILTTPPVYTRSASILVKEDLKGRSIATDAAAAFSSIGFVQTNVNVNNEIINFQSPDLMCEVVKRLGIDTEYKEKDLRYDRTLYGDRLPLRLEFLDLPDNGAASLTLKPAGEGQYTLTDFVLPQDKSQKKQTVSAALKDTVATPLGRIVLHEPAYANVPVPESSILVTKRSPYAAARGILGRLSVALSSRDATVINLSLQDVNVQRATEILNMMINVYNEIWIKDKNQISTATNEFIADRLRIIEEELGDVDRTISSFRSEHRIPDAAASVGLDMQLSAEAGRDIQALNNQLSIARYLAAYIRDARGSLLPSNAGLSEPGIQAQINQFNTTQLQRNRLAESSSERNVLVQDLDRQLDAQRSNILSSIDNYTVSLETQLASSRSAQSRADARVSNSPRQAGQLLSDERQQKVKESLYLFLLQKREENELTQAFTAYNTRVVAQPNGSGAPVAPNKKMILLVALLLGLAIPFGWIYLREATNNTVRGRKDLENMSVPFLGELPAAYKPKWTLRDLLTPRRQRFLKENPEERKIVVKPRSRNIINEAFRVVRTNLEFIHGKEGEGAYVVMLTSMNPGSGKTFISANLATAFAVKGKRVLAIDLDLRKQSLSYFAGKPKTGLADYLSGRVDDFKSLIVKGEEKTPDWLPVGTLPPNPAELLADPRLERMITALRPAYDYIFLDCPPVEIVTDADLIKSLADATVFVVRAGLLDRVMLPEIDKLYIGKRYNNMALLLNGTDGGGRYGYKYGYKYGYRYGSNYGSYGSVEENAQA